MFRLVSCVIRTMVCYAEHTDTHLGTGDRDRTASGCARATVFSLSSRVRSQRATAPEIDAHAARGGARAARGGGPAPRPRARARRPPRPAGGVTCAFWRAPPGARAAPAAPARARAADDA